MAKVNSVFQVSGSIGDATFFVRNGKTFVRKKSNLDRKRLKSDPAFQRTLEAAAEFGGASTIARSIVDALQPWYRETADGNAWNRLKSRVHKALKAGPGERGKREFEPKTGIALLKGYEICESQPMQETLIMDFAPYPPSMMGDWALDVPAFDPKKTIKAPEGATHFRIRFAPLILTPFEFSETLGCYAPSKATRKPLAGIQEAPWFSLYDAEIPPQKFYLKFPSQTGEGVMACIGIQFSQESDGVFYPMKSGAALKLLGMG